MTRLATESIPFFALALLFAGAWLVVHNLLPVVFHAGSISIRYVTRFVFDRWFSRGAGTDESDSSDRIRMWSSIAAITIVGAAVTLAVGDAFFDLAEALQSNSEVLSHVDDTVYEWAALYRSRSATLVFTVLTIIGTPVGLGLMVALAAIAILLRHQRRLAAYLVLTTGGGALLNVALKLLFARARPDLAEALRPASGFSFPSGHAMGSVIVFGALAYVAARLLPRWKQKSAAIALAFTLAVAISASRVYLGVHWISDIGAGVSAGVAWLATTTLAYELFRRLRAVRVRRRRDSGSDDIADA